MQPKRGRERTRFHDSLDGVDLGAAFSAGLSRRAGRPVRIEVGLDPLTMRVDGRRRLVRTRTDPTGRAIMIPAFSLPLTLRGAPEDLSFAYLAGLGAKTTGGFGCPILPV
jgi:CRISPR-associated endoribonuclease Cas6